MGIVTGEYAFYDMERGSFFVTQEAHLVRYDESDSLIVIADRLEFFPDSTKAEAQGNVIIEVPLQNFTATSEYARYFGDQNRLELLGSPVLNSPDGELSGDWQEILFENQELIQVRVEGNAKGYFIESGIDPPGESWMSSQHALFMFSEGVIDSVSIEGSVEVIVKSGGEAAARAEVNTVRGEKLEMKFMKRVIDMVIVVGHVSGTYSYFEE